MRAQTEAVKNQREASEARKLRAQLAAGARTAQALRTELASAVESGLAIAGAVAAAKAPAGGEAAAKAAVAGRGPRREVVDAGRLEEAPLERKVEGGPRASSVVGVTAAKDSRPLAESQGESRGELRAETETGLRVARGDAAEELAELVRSVRAEVREESRSELASELARTQQGTEAEANGGGKWNAEFERRARQAEREASANGLKELRARVAQLEGSLAACQRARDSAQEALARAEFRERSLAAELVESMESHGETARAAEAQKLELRGELREAKDALGGSRAEVERLEACRARAAQAAGEKDKEQRSQLAAKDKELACLRSDLDVSRAAAESVAASFKVWQRAYMGVCGGRTSISLDDL